MGTLRVDPHGLSAFSASYGLRAVTVRGALGSAGNRGPFFQATSAAVTNSDAMVDAAFRTLAERIDDLIVRNSRLPCRCTRAVTTNLPRLWTAPSTGFPRERRHVVATAVPLAGSRLADRASDGGGQSLEGSRRHVDQRLRRRRGRSADSGGHGVGRPGQSGRSSPDVARSGGRTNRCPAATGGCPDRGQRGPSHRCGQSGGPQGRRRGSHAGLRRSGRSLGWRPAVLLAATAQSFGQCWADDFKDDVGMGMVRGALTGGVFGALRGAAVGVFFGVRSGSSAEPCWVSSAARRGGAMITGPLLTAGKSVWDCV
jgi:hypothetical protein